MRDPLIIQIECWRDGVHGVQRVSSRLVPASGVFQEYEQSADSMTYASRVTGYDHWTEAHPLDYCHWPKRTEHATAGRATAPRSA